MSSPSGRVMSSAPARSVVPMPSTCTPSQSSVRGIVGIVAPTPIEPVSVVGLAQISSAAIEIQ